MFQHTAARRRLGINLNGSKDNTLFQHTAARRRLLWDANIRRIQGLGFNTQPPEGGCVVIMPYPLKGYVSTHSRPKAAATGV